MTFLHKLVRKSKSPDAGGHRPSTSASSHDKAVPAMRDASEDSSKSKQNLPPLPTSAAGEGSTTKTVAPATSSAHAESVAQAAPTADLPSHHGTDSISSDVLAANDSRTSTSDVAPQANRDTPSVSLPRFDAFDVPLPSTTNDEPAGETSPSANKSSDDETINTLSSQLESSVLSSAARLSAPFLESRAAPPKNVVPDWSTPSHDEQNADLLEKIRAEHPVKVPLTSEGEDLFASAGLEVHDRQGRGTVDWEQIVEEPVVHEIVRPHVHHDNEHVLVARTFYETHVHPKIEPVIRERSDDPEEELHYFPAPVPGHYYEVRGRARALSIVRASGGKDEIIADYWCDRAVQAERAELQALLHDRVGRVEDRPVLESKRWGQTTLLPATDGNDNANVERDIVGQHAF